DRFRAARGRHRRTGAAGRPRGADHRRVRRHADAAGIGDPVRSQPPGRAMSAAASPRPTGGFPARIGQAVVAPRAAAARIEAEGGSLRDALWLVVLGVLTFRLPELCRVLLAVSGPATGSLMRVAGLFLDETRDAAWVVLPAAVIVTAAAGSRRDATRDLDLGAACYAPYFALRALARLVDGVTGMRLLRG